VQRIDDGGDSEMVDVDGQTEARDQGAGEKMQVEA